MKVRLYLFVILVWSVLSYGSGTRKNESICYGTTHNGRLSNGVKLPLSGDNFVTFSYLLYFWGRTYVHDEVRSIMIKRYQRLAKEWPDKVFKYAETGHKDGGDFSPHKTHRNGLSVDHMVPVLKGGQSVHLPTNLFNKWG